MFEKHMGGILSPKDKNQTKETENIKEEEEEDLPFRIGGKDIISKFP
jgi:hypothetical protein